MNCQAISRAKFWQHFWLAFLVALLGCAAPRRAGAQFIGYTGQQTINQPKTQVLSAVVAPTTVNLTNIGQGAHWLVYCISGGSATSVAIALEGSMDGTNWFLISRAGTAVFGCTTIEGGGYFPLVRVNLSAYTPNGTTLSAWYSAMAAPLSWTLELQRYANAFSAALDSQTLATQGIVGDDNNAGTIGSIPALADLRDRVVSPANTQTQKVYDLRNLRGTLALSAVCSAGTAALTVEVSSDNSNWITIDSLVAAGTQTKQYTETTVGATTALSPLSFRWVRITEATCGPANTSTLTVAAK